MQRKTFRPSSASGGSLIGLCFLSAFASPVHAQYDPNWERNFRLGAIVGFNIKTEFKLTGAAIKLASGNNGIYDNGYVIPDPQSTGNRFTSNWGYDSADQFDAANQLLTFQKTTEFRPDSGTGTRTDDSISVGVDLEYGGYPWRWDRTRLGWTFGFGFLPISGSQSVSAAGNKIQTIYQYRTGSPVIPDAPYHGNAGGDGFNLDSDPDFTSQGDEVEGTLKGEQTLDVSLFTFRLGPTLFFDLHPKLGLAVGAGPAFGLVTGNYEFDDVITSGGDEVRNRGDFGVSDFIYGGYLNATLTYHATLNGDFYLGAQYMPMGSAEFSKAGRAAKLDLSGAIYLSAGINWPF